MFGSDVTVQNGEQPGNDVKYEPEAFWTAFWPFVTPDDALISEGAWDDMEGVIAIASSCRLLVARLSDTGGYEELWSYTTPNVSLPPSLYMYLS